MSKGLVQDGWRKQAASGGNCYVADLEHPPKRVASYSVGDVGLPSFIHVSLCGSGAFWLESGYWTQWRDTGGGAGLREWRRLLTRHHPSNGDISCEPHPDGHPSSDDRQETI